MSKGLEGRINVGVVQSKILRFLTFFVLLAARDPTHPFYIVRTEFVVKGSF